MKRTFRSISLALAALFAATAALAQDQHAGAGPASAVPAAATCPVSGDKLGEMGEPVSYVYKQAGHPDRVVQFCCKDCIKDFEKDPAKYLAKLDGTVTVAAAAGRTTGEGCPMGSCCADDAGCELLQTYVPIATALAADDFDGARTAAGVLAKQAKADGMESVAERALGVKQADSIATARTAFKALSKEMEPMAKHAKGYVVMSCPMAKADWIQTDAGVRNPYFGKMMLTCGAPKVAAD